MPTIFITGGAQRLGLALAQKSVELGYNVIIQYRSTNDDAAKWLRANTDVAHKVTFLQAELLESSSTIIQTAFEQCVDQGDTLVGLINNASIFTKGDIGNLDHFHDTLRINTLIPLELGKVFADIVRNGWIINMIDAHIKPPNSNFQNYRISKLFLEELTRQMAFTFAPRIRVNGIAPGAILKAKETPQKEYDALANLIPLKRTGTVEPIVKAYEYLLHNDYVTGEVLKVDGGWHLK